MLPRRRGSRRHTAPSLQLLQVDAHFICAHTAEDFAGHVGLQVAVCRAFDHEDAFRATPVTGAPVWFCLTLSSRPIVSCRRGGAQMSSGERREVVPELDLRGRHTVGGHDVGPVRVWG